MLRAAVQSALSHTPGASLSPGTAAALVLLNVASFGTFCAIAFGRNEPFLFHGLDGSYVLTLANEQLTWAGLQPGFTSNFLQSLGNVWFPMNAPAIPGYAIADLINRGSVDSVTPYVVFALEMFVTVLALARYVGLGWPLATVAAWSLALLAYPFFELPVLYALMALVPQFGTVVAVTVMLILAFGEVNDRSIVGSLGALLWMVASALYLAISQPTAFLLIAPILALFGLCQLFSAPSRREMIAKTVGAACAIGLFVLAGAAHFVLGLLKFTAVYFFPSDFLNDRMTAGFVSIAFQGKAGATLFVLGCLGASIAAVHGGRRARTLGRALLACAGLIVVLGLITLKFDFWRGPSPLYFEFLLWPFYAVFAAVLLRTALDLGWRLAASRRTTASAARFRERGVAVMGTVALAPWAVVLLSANPGSARFHPYPPVKSPIVATLEREVGLAPGREFRGRVATLTGRGNVDRPYSWFDLHALDARLIQKLGNDHRMVGLWYYDVPTLIEYSPLITPPFHLFARTFFALPGDRQVRNVVTLRKAHASMLAAIGVRFVLTDSLLAEGTLRARASLDELGELYLYELPSPNLGQYSPTIGVRSSSASETLALLARREFDTQRSFVSAIAPPGDLTRASSVRIIADRSELRVDAKSAGRSVILLPIEFSHCLRLQPTGESKEPPTLFRANLLQAAILFDSTLAASIRYFTGPFQDQTCRLKDAEEIRGLLP